jgi:hypothetical protein
MAHESSPARLRSAARHCVWLKSSATSWGSRTTQAGLSLHADLLNIFGADSLSSYRLAQILIIVRSLITFNDVVTTVEYSHRFNLLLVHGGMELVLLYFQASTDHYEMSYLEMPCQNRALAPPSPKPNPQSSCDLALFFSPFFLHRNEVWFILPTSHENFEASELIKYIRLIRTRDSRLSSSELFSRIKVLFQQNQHALNHMEKVASASLNWFLVCLPHHPKLPLQGRKLTIRDLKDWLLELRGLRHM